MIFINFQPFQKQIFNFLQKKKNRPPAASPAPPLTPPDLLSDPPKSPQDPPEATQNRPRSSPVLRFSDPRAPCPSVLSPCLWIFAGYIDTVSILYRYCIDTVSIQYRYRLQKSKDRGLWGRKTEAQASFGVDPGSLRGDPGVTLGGQREVRGGQRRVRGGRRRPNFFFHFRRFKIMKLCQNLNFLWKRLEID